MSPKYESLLPHPSWVWFGEEMAGKIGASQGLKTEGPLVLFPGLDPKDAARVLHSYKTEIDEWGIQTDVLSSEKIVNLPDPKDNVRYIASFMVGKLAHRDDVYNPGLKVRGTDGKVKYTQGLVRIGLKNTAV